MAERGFEAEKGPKTSSILSHKVPWIAPYIDYPFQMYWLPLSDVFQMTVLAATQMCSQHPLPVVTRDISNVNEWAVASTKCAKLIRNIAHRSPSTCTRGATSSSFWGRAIFMKFHSMTTLSCLFNRGTTFSQTVTYNNDVFCPQTRSA